MKYWQRLAFRAYTRYGSRYVSLAPNASFSVSQSLDLLNDLVHFVLHSLDKT